MLRANADECFVIVFFNSDITVKIASSLVCNSVHHPPNYSSVSHNYESINVLWQFVHFFSCDILHKAFFYFLHFVTPVILLHFDMFYFILLLWLFYRSDIILFYLFHYFDYFIYHFDILLFFLLLRLFIFVSDVMFIRRDPSHRICNRPSSP